MKKYVQLLVSSEGLYLVLWVGAGLIAGALLHAGGWGAFLGLAGYLLQQLWNVLRLTYWMFEYPEGYPPELTGIWQHIALHVYRVQQQERRASKEQLSIMQRAQMSVAALEEAVVLISAQNLLEWWNPAAERLLGLSSRDYGKNILHLLRTPEFYRFYQEGRSGEGLRIPSPLQADHFIQCELTRFGDNERLIIAYDVTRMTQLENIRKDFVANVSHELRTPLTVILGYLETLSDQQDIPPRWQRPLQQMQTQAKRMGSIIHDLLILARLEKETASAPFHSFDLTALIHDLFDDAQTYNAHHQHTLNLHIESPCMCLGNAQDIGSVLLNLMTNAIKYTPPGGIIDISWDVDSDYGRFSVRDNGIGIDPVHIKRLTERFYRVDSARSRETGGTGLGLAIVKHVLKQHEGKLEIESVRDQGSTFTAMLPLKRLQPV